MKINPKDPQPAEAEENPFTAEEAAGESALLRQELAEQKELSLRVAADFENFKRRTRQEGDVRAAAQKESFIHELLPAIDNLERALASGPTADSNQFHHGVVMTLQQLRQLLRQHGIDSEEIVGQPFNPHRHEAISQRLDSAKGDQTILEVLQRGYLRNEKVFRAAKVVVNNLTQCKPRCHAP